MSTNLLTCTRHNSAALSIASGAGFGFGAGLLVGMLLTRAARDRRNADIAYEAGYRAAAQAVGSSGNS